MLLKPGVDISRLNREIRRVLNELDRIYKNYGDTLIITSTYEGNHSPSSLHYANNAIDIRIPAREKNTVLADIKNTIGKTYDVICEIDHIHIEYDPKE
uniref:Putative peptidase n=1 Tax=viral metagenome TaxID=1070528 RepID=A0A6M3LEQ0_9ZZZZ